MTTAFTLLCLGALLAMTAAPDRSERSEPVPFDSARWQFAAAGHRLEEHLGRPSLYLANGVAWLSGARLTHGRIDFDVAFSAERGFMGGIWHVADSANFELFFVRPHQSGNPDATQYTPVWNGVSGWQLYHGAPYSVPLVLHPGAWVHVRIVFSDTRAEVYVGDMSKPAQTVEELLRGTEPGSVGLSVGEISPAHFADFSYTALDASPFPERPASPVEPAPAGVIPSWSVSDAFPESALDGKTALTPEDLAARRWTPLRAERSGLANLARVQGVGLRQNTVFARKVVVSAHEQIRRLDFGFCNRVRVYLNGRLLYRGDAGYRSRDYRFLGSIGYFDALYLPLAQGKNEIVMAVSENPLRGGWGIQAKLDDPADLVLAD